MNQDIEWCIYNVLIHQPNRYILSCISFALISISLSISLSPPLSQFLSLFGLNQNVSDNFNKYIERKYEYQLTDCTMATYVPNLLATVLSNGLSKLTIYVIYYVNMYFWPYLKFEGTHTLNNNNNTVKR